MISAFRTCLIPDLKTLKTPIRPSSDFFDEFELVKTMFFEDALKQIEIFSSPNTYLTLIKVLGYINNNKVGNNKAFNFPMSEKSSTLLYNVFYKNVLQLFENP